MTLATPGGAHLVGSVNHLDRQARFPAYCDVDIAIIVDSVAHQQISSNGAAIGGMVYAVARRNVFETERIDALKTSDVVAAYLRV